MALWSDVPINSFTVTDGEITSASFLADEFVHNSSYVFQIGTTINSFITLSALEDDQFTPPNGSQLFQVSINTIPTSLSFTASVPEPSTLLIGGLAGVCGIAYGVASKCRAKRFNMSGP